MRCRLALLIIGVWLLWPAAGHAQTPSPFTGLDLLFIVDQSGSMGGPVYGGAALYGDGSDPDGLRFRAPTFALEQLALYAERDALAAPRVALLNFGTDPDLQLNWTVVTPDQLAALRPILSPERFGERNLGFTDFLRAFAAGRDLIAAAPSTGPDERRLSAIILLTDGSPCVDTALLRANGAFNCQQPRLEQEAPHLQALAAFMAESLPNTRLYVVALDRDDEYFQRLQPFWEEVACTTAAACALPLQATQVRNSADLGLQIGRVLSDLVTELSVGLRSAERAADEPFTVPPYAQLLTVTAFKATAEPLPQFQLIGPNGAAASVTLSGAETPIEQLQVALPQPGTWRIAAPDSADVRFQSEVLLALPRANLAAESGTVYAPLDLRVALSDDVSGAALPVYTDDEGDPLFPLNVTLAFHDARPFDRAARPLIFSVDLAQADGTAQIFAATLRPQLPGVYEVRATATYTTPEGDAVTLVEAATVLDRFEIAAASIAWEGFDVASQRATGTVNISAAVVTDDGAPLADVGPLTLELTDADAAAAPFYLADAGSVPGRLQVPWTVTEPGTYRYALRLGVGEGAAFEPLVPQTPFSAPLSVRPVQALTLQLTLPRADASQVQAPYPRFWTTTPLPIQLSLTDDRGELVDLALLTNGAEAAPTVRLLREGEALTIDPATQTRTGIYALNVPNLGVGTYQIEATIETDAADLLGDYTWERATVVAQHRRENAPYVLPLVSALAAATIVILASGAWLGISTYRRHIAITHNPMVGRLSIGSLEGGDLVPLWEVDLRDLGRNTHRFTRRDLRGLPFSELEVTNNAARSPEDRRLVTVTRLLARTDAAAATDLVPPVLVLQPGESRSLPTIELNTVPVTYVIGLDSTVPGTSAAQTAFQASADRF